MKSLVYVVFNNRYEVMPGQPEGTAYDCSQKVICDLMSCARDQVKHSVSATLGVEITDEDLVYVDDVADIPPLCNKTRTANYEIRVNWAGPNLYQDIFRDGKHIGRAWVGGENEEYDGDIWEASRPTTEEAVRELMGDALDEALATGKCVRYDL